MLTELRVRDLAVIADVTIAVRPGLNALTGETGAGKSMLVDALALLLGERATGDLVRPGAARAVVEAAFDVTRVSGLAALADKLGVELEEGRLVIRREINAEGRNRAWANGSPTTIATLSTLGRHLVDLHGQHEAQSLLGAGAQRDLLDAFAGAEGECAAMADAYAGVARLREAAADLTRKRDDIRRRADYLRHVAREIADARIQLGEDDALAGEARRLGNVEELTRLTERLTQILDDEEAGAFAALNAANRVLTQLEKIDPDAARWRELLDDATTAVGELARAVQEYGSAIERDPARLEEVERRRDLLYRLTQKHGPALADVLKAGEEATGELATFDAADIDLAGIARELAAAEKALAAQSAALSVRRAEAGVDLGKAVSRLLPGLGLPRGKLTVSVSATGAIGVHGADRVEFLVQLNAGLEARPLAEVASGGELSRLMLALKVVLAAHDAVPTLVFDEVDQGIGAEVGIQVANALAQVAKSRQVLVISHLAQIAARASHHLVVSKAVRRGVATAEVEVLTGEGRLVEVTRMLGDSRDPVLRQHASELLSRTPATVGG